MRRAVASRVDVKTSRFNTRGASNAEAVERNGHPNY